MSDLKLRTGDVVEITATVAIPPGRYDIQPDEVMVDLPGPKSAILPVTAIARVVCRHFEAGEMVEDLDGSPVGRVIAVHRGLAWIDPGGDGAPFVMNVEHLRPVPPQAEIPAVARAS